MKTDTPALLDPMQYARVLVAVGELREAEQVVAEVLMDHPDDLVALGLLAKIKHCLGELSEAIACWSQLHARTPQHEHVRMHLASMVDLARDPERSAGEFLALGQYQLIRKPVAHLELEEAFRLFVARKPVDARAHCQRIAGKYKERDREVFKLANLAESFICEISGDLTGAATVLENLGQIRGYETDMDRILPLASLYEQLGGTEKLKAAVNICRFIERTHPSVIVAGRLSQLYQRLDKKKKAAKYATRHLADFRAGMYRPSFTDLIAVAAKSYLPLRKLRAVPCPVEELPDEASLTERALVYALAGEAERAELLFNESDRPIDHKYLADLTFQDDDWDRSRKAIALVLREDPRDLHLLRTLLGRHPLPTPIRDLLRDNPTVALTAEEVLVEAIDGEPRDHRLLRALTNLLETTGADQGRLVACARQTQTLEVAAERRENTVGRVLTAAIYRFVGKAKGLIHEIWADRQPVEPGAGGQLPIEHIYGNLTDEMKDAVRNTFLSTRGYATATFPHLVDDILDYNYSFRITKDDEPSGGTSAGLPTALAFLSVFLQQPVPQNMAFTGVIVTDAHDVLSLGNIGDAEFKVKGAYNRDLKVFVMPASNRADLGTSALVPEAIRDEFCSFARNLDDAVKLAGMWPSIRTQSEPARVQSRLA